MKSSLDIKQLLKDARRSRWRCWSLPRWWPPWKWTWDARWPFHLWSRSALRPVRRTVCSDCGGLSGRKCGPVGWMLSECWVNVESMLSECWVNVEWMLSEWHQRKLNRCRNDFQEKKTFISCLTLTDSMDTHMTHLYKKIIYRLYICRPVYINVNIR